MPQQKTFGFIADPPANFDPDAETTLFLMREVERRGHKALLCEMKDLFLKQGECWGVFGKRKINLKKLTAIFLRKDPPFNQNYLSHLWLLSQVEGKVCMINEPSAILKHNEKLSPLNFPYSPKTWVGSRADLLQEWAKPFQEGIVLKPLNDAGGRGVRWLKPNQIRAVKLSEPMLAQEYLSAAKNGDLRVMIWNGNILGSFRRIPKKGEFRANLHMGGDFVAHRITRTQEKIAKEIGKWCKRVGLYFVGLDLIGNQVTEINVTSPMGIREVNVLYGVQIERKIIGDILNCV